MGFFRNAFLCQTIVGIATAISVRGAQSAETPDGYTREEFLRTNLIRVPFEAPTETAAWLQKRKAAQETSSSSYKVFHDFQFSNRLDETGITFRHQIVDDAGKTFKPTHYDHGTGLAVADVDGDGLIDIYFVNQTGGNELWRNLGNGKFENITSRAGVALKDKVCVTASFADVDNDGKPDLFVTTVNMGNVLFHNLGGGKFQNVSKQAGVDAVAHSSGAVFFDFDNDGLLDLFLCNVGKYTSNEKGPDGAFRAYADAFQNHLIPERWEQSVLYRNLGGLKFKDVSAEVHLKHVGSSGDASFCDLNGDGFPDLYVLNMSGNDAFYENQHGTGFVERTSMYFGKTPWGSMGLNFFDYNQDGRIDLFITDMHSDMSPPQLAAGSKNKTIRFEKEKSEQWCIPAWNNGYFPGGNTNFIFGNALYRNGSALPLTEISGEMNAETYWPWGFSVGDLNADGYEDVFITAGMGYPSRYGLNSVFLNEQGKVFRDAEFLLGIEPRWPSTEIDYFVLDCSGTDKDNPLCYHKRGKLTVRSSTSSRSSAVCDLNNDGALDIVVNNMNDRPQVFFNDLANKKKLNWIKIALRGTRSNRDGLGAWVKVTAANRTYMQNYSGKSGYLSQSSLPLYFGLGNETQLTSVEVRWPSGRSQLVSTNLQINRLITITEADK